jgi:L-ascorbate metabolism protein UlaG (beta-lactamase superfamily)
MEILGLGHSAFKIIGKEITIVTDPFDPETVGFPFPKVEADVVTVSHSHSDHNFLKGVKGDFICFDSPGEYEIKNSEIVGIDSFHDDKNGSERGHNTIFSLEVDGIHICHLGDLGTSLSSDQLEKIDGADILIIPVGGVKVIDPKAAVKVISEIEPKIVIPVHYKEGKLTDFEPLEHFVKEIGKDPKKTDRLKIQKKDLPEQLEIYTLVK